MLFLSYLSINVTQESSLGSFTEIELLSKSFNCLSWVLTGIDSKLLGVFTVELDLEDADWLFLGLRHVVLFICGEVWVPLGVVCLWFLLHDLWMIHTWSWHAWVFVALSSGSGGAWVSEVLWQLLLASAVREVSAFEWVLCWSSSDS